MSLPPPPGAPMAPTAPRAVPMPATPGSPLEPLRSGRRLDRRHWLLAGLLGITGGAIVLLQAQGPLVTLLGRPEQYGWDVVSQQLGVVVFGVVMTAIAYLSAPGSVGRRILAVGVLVVLVVAGFALQHMTLYGAGVPSWSRWIVSGGSLVVLGGIVGWVLASGARWWAWLSVLLVPVIAAVPTASALAGLPSGVAGWLVPAAALVVALLVLTLTVPRRR